MSQKQEKMFKGWEVVRCVAGMNRNTAKSPLNLAMWRSLVTLTKTVSLWRTGGSLTDVVSRKHEKKVEREAETVSIDSSFQEVSL